MIEHALLREWQRDAWTLFQSNNYCGIIEVATGGGKTTFALYAFQEMLKSNPDLSILVVVPTSALQDQWYVNFTEDLRSDPKDISLLNSRSTDQALKRINIVIINSARDLRLSSFAQAKILLVVDECHRAGSEENARALKGNWLATLGLSATPDRQYDDGTERHLVPALGPKIFSYSVQEALRDGILVPFILKNVEIPLLPEERKEIDRLTQQLAMAMRRAGSDEQVDSLLRKRARTYNNARYRVPVSVSIMEQHRGERAMIFHESIDAAEEIRAILEERGHSVTIYHSRINAARRRENLRLYRIGIVDVLVTCRALDEGANMPETRVAIIAASTSSTRQRIQRLGRVLRPHPTKKWSTVYSLFATSFEHDRLLREVQSMEGLAEVEWLAVNDGI
jgi:superfamily II DNA or RNA helicase